MQTKHYFHFHGVGVSSGIVITAFFRNHIYFVLNKLLHCIWLVLNQSVVNTWE